MRLLYIHQHFTTPRGAGGIRSYQMARKLIENGCQVTMLCGRGTEGQSGLSGPFIRGLRRGKVDRIDVIEIDLIYSNRDSFLRRALTFIRFMLTTVRLVLRERYDILLATTTPLTVGVPGIAGRWLRGKPFIFEVRDLWPELPRAMGVIRNPLILGAMSLLEWASYRSAHRLVALSPGIADGIAARGIPAHRIGLVPNGCDLAIFQRPPSSWRPDHVAKGDLLAVFTGAHGLANGLDAVLDAAAELRRRKRSDIKLALVGDGMLKPGLRARADAERLENVLFLDAMPKHRLAELMAGADLGMQILADVPAFYYGTSPNKFFDYIAAGLPVLNNYPGWLADLIVAHECGFVAPPRNPAAFADALEAAANDRVALRQKGVRAGQLAHREFARDRLAEQWVAWVVAGKRPVSAAI